MGGGQSGSGNLAKLTGGPSFSVSCPASNLYVIVGCDVTDVGVPWAPFSGWPGMVSWYL